jgi:flagellar motor protein MotB
MTSKRRVLARVGAPALVLSGALTLGACSAVPDWANPVEWYNEAEGAVEEVVDDVFADDETELATPPAPSAEDYGFGAEMASSEPPPVPGESGDFPNLATVPDAAPPTSSAADLDSLMAELTADRDHAQYTDEVIRIEPVEETGLASVEQMTEDPFEAFDYSEPAVTAAPAEPWQAPQIVELETAPYQPPAPASEGLEIIELGTGQAAASTPSAPEMLPLEMVAAPAPATQQVVASVPSAPSDHGVYGVSTFKQMFDDAYNTSLASSYNQSSTASLDSAAWGEGVMSDAPSGGYAPSVVFQAATLFFNNGQAWLPEGSRGQLKDVVALHETYGGKVRVVGHASMRTRDMDLGQHRLVNFQLSSDRAQKVADELMRLGVPASAILIDAKGDSSPLTHEYMPAGEMENRRAEIFIEY